MKGFIKIMLKLLILSLVSFGAFSFFGRSGKNDLEISAEDAHEKYKNRVFLLDVRSKDEWNECHVPKAKLIPLGELQTRLKEIPQDKEIVVMCRSGARSMTATRMLRSKGYEQVVSMSGGINVWSRKNYELSCKK